MENRALTVCGNTPAAQLWRTDERLYCNHSTEQSKHQGLLGTVWRVRCPPPTFYLSYLTFLPPLWKVILFSVLTKSESARGPVGESLSSAWRASKEFLKKNKKKTKSVMNSELLSIYFDILFFSSMFCCNSDSQNIKNSHNGRRRSKGQVRQHVTVGMICCNLHCCQRLSQIRAARDGEATTPSELYMKLQLRKPQIFSCNIIIERFWLDWTGSSPHS